MISVVCWMWNGPLRTFLPAHVNALQRMVAAHLSLPHRFICVTDSPQGLAPGVEFFETPEPARNLGLIASPEGPRFPSCYRRLWSFSEEAKALGDRILVIDIDLVVMRSIDHVFARPEEFVGWRPYRDWGPKEKIRFGGGIYLLKTGTRVHVWEEFQSAHSIKKARAAGYRGSDQAWISYKLAEREVYFDKRSGLYSVRDLNREGSLPTDACIVQFNGNEKPWQSRLPWARTQWARYEDDRPAVPLPPSRRPGETLGQVLGRYRMPRA